jgi:hypothetical protein
MQGQTFAAAVATALPAHHNCPPEQRAKHTAEDPAVLLVIPKFPFVIPPFLFVIRNLFVIPQRSGGICFFLCLFFLHPAQNRHPKRNTQSTDTH